MGVHCAKKLKTGSLCISSLATQSRWRVKQRECFDGLRYSNAVSII